jgi:hypothetical protein
MNEIFGRIDVLCLPAVIIALLALPEIQVYDGGIAERGVFNLTLHNNFIAIHRPEVSGILKRPDTESVNGVPEWAYGVTDWFEVGLYLPLYSVSRHRGAAH